MTYRLLRAADSRDLFGTSNSTFYEWINGGLMTPGIHLGERARAWPLSELEAIAAARIAGKTEPEIRSLVRELLATRNGARP